MSKEFTRILKGVVLKGESSDPSDNVTGSEWFNSSTQRFKNYASGAVHEFTTNDQIQTLTNKSIDGDDNTLTDIALASLKTDAAASGTFLTRDNSGVVVSTKVAPTGTVVGTSDPQIITNKTIDRSSNALSSFGVRAVVTSDENGNLLGGVTPGSRNNALVSDGTFWTSIPRTESFGLVNLGLSSSVSASALTINLTTSTGGTAAASSPVDIGFRSSTAANGTYTTNSTTGSLSITISNGSTLGHADGVASYGYIYSIDNAGTTELAVASILFDEGARQSTTAEGGAGAADSIRTLYTTTARTNVGIRLIGRFLSTQTTAGVWTTSLTELTPLPFRRQTPSMEYTNSTTSIVNGNAILFADKTFDTHNSYSTSTGIYTIPESGKYLVCLNIASASFSANNGEVMTARISQAGSATEDRDGHYWRCEVTQSTVAFSSAIVFFNCVAGDTLAIKFAESISATVSLVGGDTQTHISIKKIGDL